LTRFIVGEMRCGGPWSHCFAIWDLAHLRWSGIIVFPASRIAPGVVPCLLFTYSLAHVSRVHAADTTLQKVFASKEECSWIGAEPKHSFRCWQYVVCWPLHHTLQLQIHTSSKCIALPLTHMQTLAAPDDILKLVKWVQEYQFMKESSGSS
jgi:hypothetical protein